MQQPEPDMNLTIFCCLSSVDESKQGNISDSDVDITLPPTVCHCSDTSAKISETLVSL